MAELFGSDQEQVRIDEIRILREMGIDPYPAAEFKVTTFAKDVHTFFPTDPERFADVILAGRVMRKRIMGKAAFAELQDSTGKIQFYVSRGEVQGFTPAPNGVEEPENFAYEQLFKKLTSLGDIVGIRGKAFVTRTGEISIHVYQYVILSKAMRPLPLPKEKDGVVYDAFTDPEQRYRMRYVDLVVNPHVRETFIKRTAMIQAMRQYLIGKGFLEVETPILQPIYGGAYARPFVTHHNTLDMTLYLRIANELYLKRLIVGGFDGVFEFAKDFRNEGMSRFHNPEFTQVELYVAYRDYLWMMDTVEEMIEHTAIAVNGTTTVQVGEYEINFARPWRRLTFFGAIQDFGGKDVSGMSDAELREEVRRVGGKVDNDAARADLLDEIFGTVVEPNLIQPTFIMDYPIEMSPLAKKHRDNPALVERFEVVCNRKEICNAYSELNDPEDQRERFMAQLLLRESGNVEAMMPDEDFLRALEYGMPPTAGLGVGIDRLAMILTNAQSIQDVLFFPQMRPEKRGTPLTAKELHALHINEAWHPVIYMAGVHSLEELVAAPADKLYAALLHWQQKLQLNLPNLSLEEVLRWRESLLALESKL